MSFLKIQTFQSNNILTTDLSPPEEVTSDMLSFFDRINQSTNDNSSVVLGDILSNASLHNRVEFDWLTNIIETLVSVYLLKGGFDSTNISCFHQKSWPVITNQNGKIDPHTHSNSDLSVVFYLQAPKDCGGNLIFESHADYLKLGRLNGKPFCGNISRSRYGIKPFPGLICIFPSSLEHHVSPYSGETPRYSITYDISITTGLGLGPGNSENFVVHPSYWREFSDGTKNDPLVTSNEDKNQKVSSEMSYASDTNILSNFLNDGFFVRHSYLSESVCRSLLCEVIKSWSNDSLIRDPEFRRHSPLPLSDISLNVLSQIYKDFSHLLFDLLPSSSCNLVELSSITSFPGAIEQQPHRDHSTNDKMLISIFINLLDVDISVGPLSLIPKTQFFNTISNSSFPHAEKQPDVCLSEFGCLPMTLPPGSIVLMDGSLVHFGSANSSANQIRPVWYCTFGDSDIHGPAYSIKSEIKGRYKLSSFSH
jgi:uncharacterized protein (TIGR02466 family)